jgi:transcriptional regulator with XRE-family HTH domain
MKYWKPEDIKNLKKKYKLSQHSLGKLLGVSRNYIYYLERGERMPSETLKLLLDCVEEKLKGKEVKK